MTKYVPTNIEFRENVDLRNYDTIITKAVLDTVQDDEPQISIAKDYFQVETTVSITDQEWAEINKILWSSELVKCQEDVQPLFTAIQEMVAEHSNN